jgi:hypothetical protein
MRRLKFQIPAIMKNPACVSVSRSESGGGGNCTRVDAAATITARSTSLFQLLSHTTDLVEHELLGVDQSSVISCNLSHPGWPLLRSLSLWALRFYLFTC